MARVIDFGRGYTRPQMDFIHNFKDKKTLFVGGFGSGKTFAGVEHMVAGMTINGMANYIHISPTYDICDLTLMPQYEETLQHYNIKYDIKRQKREIRTEFGNVYLRSGQHPERIVGANIAMVGIDEPFIQQYEVYLKATARLRDTRARIRQLFMTGTPEQMNWGYDLAEKKEVVSYRSSTIEAVKKGFVPRDYLEDLFNTYDRQWVRAYVYGEFVNLKSNLIYYNFTRDRNVRRDLPFDPALPLILMMDFNVNPMSWLVCQLHKDVLWVIDEIRIKNSDTREAIGEFITRYYTADDAKVPVYLYGDSSARARHSANSKITDLYTIEKALIQAGIRYSNQINTSNPPVRSRNNLLNGLLYASTGKVRILVAEKNIYLIKDLISADYKDGTFIPNKIHNERIHGVGHMADALGYGSWKIYKRYIRNVA